MKLFAAVLSAMLITPVAMAVSTPGTVNLTATISNYTGSSGTRHDTVVWVTGPTGFIKTLWKQGPGSGTSFSGDVAAHCTVWNTARAGSTAFDGFTSATAQNYTAVAPPAIGNNPITVNWNCTDVDKVTVVPDGTYNFFIQYAEDTSLAPVTSALTWIKGPSPHSPVIANQGSSGSPTNGFNFTNISITWTPAGAATPPAFTSGAAPAGKVGTAYSHNLKASGTTPITFGTTGTLPGGLTLTNGVLSGTPTTAGTFTGTFTASNGTTPNASQSFSIVITQAPAFTSGAAPAGKVGTAYSHTLTASGTTPITFGSTGNLPGGLTLTNGVLSGTPTTAGTFTGTFTASNGTTPNASQSFSIVINTPPTFAGYAFASPYQKPTTVSLNKLKANASDADGDAIIWSIPNSSSTNGGTVALQPDSILYTPATAFSGADSFSVTLTDSRGAATIGTVTVTVGLASTVADGNPVGNAPRLTVLPGGNIVLTFQGIPFQPYQIQRTTNLATVAWSILDTVTASSVGTVTFTDTSPPTGSAFYRLAVP